MPEKTITEIPADPKLNSQRYCSRKLRVAAYCRVSTEEEEQHSSFDVQVKYYTEKIMNHPGWQLAGIFADEGISGVLSLIHISHTKEISIGHVISTYRIKACVL